MTPDERKEFGKEIAAMRIKKGWNQRQLAKEAEVSLGTVQNLEGGKRQTQPELLGRILDALEYKREAPPWSNEVDGFLQMIGWRLNTMPHAEQVERIEKITRYVLFGESSADVGQQ